MLFHIMYRDCVVIAIGLKQNTMKFFFTVLVDSWIYIVWLQGFP